jgi:hypothetical protein
VDALSVVLPGAQSLVSAILTDGWSQVRGALARRWSKKGSISQDVAEQRLDAGHENSLLVVGGGEDRRALLEAYWAGYLAGMAADRADLLDVIREFGTPSAQSSQGTAVHNSNTGSVRTLLQLGDVHGDISIGDR